jgi:hypothetical protein
MNNHEEHISEEIRNPEVQYDRTDMSARGVVAFLIGLAIAGVLIHIILWGMYKYLAKQDLQSQPSTHPIATSEKQLQPQGDPSQTFPSPRLQPDPILDLNKFRQREEQVLNSYEWVDQKAGTVRVPISRAMQLIEQRGLPVRPQPGSQPQAKFGAGESGAGRGGGKAPDNKK